MIDTFVAISINFPILFVELIVLVSMPARLVRQNDQINRLVLLKMAITYSKWLSLPKAKGVTFTSCGAAVRVKPKARLCEGNNILEES